MTDQVRLEGFVVIKRVNWHAERAAEGQIRTVPSVPLSADEVFRSYRGIDGEPWPEFLPENDLSDVGLLPAQEYQAIESYFNVISRKHYCDLLYLKLSDHNEGGPTLPETFMFLGYDYGFFSSQYSVFSSVFHEVIYGRYGEVRAHACLLNNNLLFPNPQDAEALGQTRDRLLMQGADLEGDVEPFRAIAVYGRP